MIILPLHTPILKHGDDLAALLLMAGPMQSGDIIAVSSKAIATVEGARIDLTNVTITADAERYAKETGRSARFIQAAIEETQRLNGQILSASPGALLTQVRPAGLPTGTILTANAGLDESNVEPGFAIGWPSAPVTSAVQLKKTLEASMTSTPSVSSDSSISSPQQNSALPLKLATIITDSTCHPRRTGVTAFALACAGIDPIVSERGKKDLFERDLRITNEAVADQLATAANAVMGNAGQSVPAAIIRDHGIALSDFAGWVPGIEPEEDLFRGVI